MDAKYPTNWKISRITPIFKKGNISDLNNYRPISLLSVPGKILEDVVSNTLDNHKQTNNLASNKQWGFFDSVNHTILWEKLKAVGVSGNMFSWISDYMCNQKQFTQINGKI